MREFQKQSTQLDMMVIKENMLAYLLYIKVLECYVMLVCALHLLSCHTYK
uniref:Uncharacterized protein n=1 Tax=Arundo donax TaxID=35708 RepID=A0A0A9BG70_ARUDO